MIQPPSVGPIDGASTATSPYSAKACPRLCGSKLSAMMACAMGCNPPPPAPWITRNTSSSGSDGAMPHRKLDAVKIMMHTTKKFRRPIRFEAQPPSGSTIAFETR